MVNEIGKNETETGYRAGKGIGKTSEKKIVTVGTGAGARM